ncbi:MAG TPA: hypothetical protein VHX38_40550 [Pseudonocardiaceae bacterium]|nr:hypothetical protein [Pseudonocardiaceae bacterium]
MIVGTEPIDDGGARRGMLGRQAVGLAFAVLLGLLIAGLLSEATTSAEWGRAFGTDQPITGTVNRVLPNTGSTRTCTLDSVVLTWQDGPTVRAGYFDVCSDEIGNYPTGARVAGWAPPIDANNDPVGVNLESRGGAIFGVILDSLLVLAVLAAIVGLAIALVRTIRAPKVLGRRPASGMSVVGRAAPRRGRRQRSTTGSRFVLVPAGHPAVSLSGDLAVSLSGTWLAGTRLVGRVTRRRDLETLADNDAVTAIPTGRSLLRRRPVGPVALVREADRKLFWSTTLQPEKPT